MKLEVGDEFKVDDVYDYVVDKTELYIVEKVLEKENTVEVLNKTTNERRTFLYNKDGKFRKCLLTLFKEGVHLTSGYRFELLKNA